jgi:hypothetical protein
MISLSKVKDNFIEKFINCEDADKKIIIKSLLVSFDEVIKDTSPSNLFLLEKIRDDYNTGYDFGDEYKNRKSLYNWLLYSRSLYALGKLGSKRDNSQLQEESDRAKRRLAIIDFYTDDRDFKYCLSGIWSEVATFDPIERTNFLIALKEGNDLPYDLEIIDFFENYCFSYN